MVDSTLFKNRELYVYVDTTTKRNVIPHDDNIDSILQSTFIVHFISFVNVHNYILFTKTYATRNNTRPYETQRNNTKLFFRAL